MLSQSSKYFVLGQVVAGGVAKVMAWEVWIRLQLVHMAP